MIKRMTALALAAAVVMIPPTAYAQQTEPRQPAAIHADTPQEPGSDSGFVAKVRRFADDTKIVERLNGDVDGWYPRLGRMTRGGGFAVGPGYRFHAVDERIFVDLSAGFSIKGYRAVDANVRWLQAFEERVELWTDFRYEDFPQEDFFGTGVQSALGARTSYDFNSVDVAVRGLVKPQPWLSVGTNVGLMSPDIGPGTDDQYPSIEALFTDADAPGLLAQPNFLHSTFFAEADYRDQRGNPGSGGFYRGSLGIWDDRTLGQYDFKRFDALAIQYVPLVASKTHVLSGRTGLSYVNNETGHRVPFYFLAYVGGTDTIRSYREFRFKDENALWLGAEYKWTLHKYFSLAGFVDAGEVAPDWQDIDFTGWKKGYGFGFRVHTRKQTFARFDFGTGGGEGWQMFMKLGPSSF